MNDQTAWRRRRVEDEQSAVRQRFLSGEIDADAATRRLLALDKVVRVGAHPSPHRRRWSDAELT